MRTNVLICFMLTGAAIPGCGVEPSVEAPLEEPTVKLSVTIEKSENYTGWLYSYGMEWVLCETQSTWYLPSIIQSAHASHPITYTQIGEWSWHQRILIGEEQELVFEGPLGNKRYCGLHWLFAHGGITANGILSSFQVEQGDEVMATSHHAWALNIEFDQPLCSQYADQTVQVVIPTQTWLGQTMTKTTAAQNTREATLRLSDFVTMSSPSCP